MDPTSPDSLTMLASIIAIFVYMQRLLRVVKLLHILYNFRQHNRKRWGGRRAMEKRFIRQAHIRRIIYDSHPTAVGLRGKPFPYLEQLSTIFGKDHATGVDAESPADAARNIDEEEELMTLASTQDPDVEMLFMEQSSARINTSNGGTSAKSKKRKSPLGEDDAVNEQFCSTLRSLKTSFIDANQHLGEASDLRNCAENNRKL